MNIDWEDISNLPISDFIGREVRYKNPRTKRFNKGEVYAVSRGGVRVTGKGGRSLSYYVSWDDLDF